MSITVVKTGLTKTSSAEYLDEIKQLYLSGTDKRLILVVPDSFSYTAEKRICDTIGGCGINGVEVITFHQLSRAVAGNTDIISNVGKQILIKKAINSCFDDDSVFVRSKNKPGFVAEMLDTVSTWKKYCVDESEIRLECDGLAEGTAKRKLGEISDVYAEYKKLLSENPCADSSDELIYAANEIISDEKYEGAYIWIDEFTEFSPPELEVIHAFLKQNATVKIYLPIEDDTDGDSICNIVYGTYYDLVKMADEAGIRVSVETAYREKQMSDDVKFLCRNYDTDAVYSGISDNIRLHKADDTYSETEYVASQITSLVTDYGYEFSDVAVLCGDLNSYVSCLEAVFNKYKIPYYSDYKVPLAGHPVSILILSVFDIVRNMAFPLKSVVRYLKTGYPIGNGDSPDIITDFVKKRGIKGSMWLNPKYFETDADSFFAELTGASEHRVKNAEQLEELRCKITEPLCNYAEASRGKKTVKEHIRAFFEFLTEIKLFEKIERRVELCEESGDENEATRLMHVWNILVDIFNQLANAVGDEFVTREIFEEYLNAGIESSEISVIPAVTNGVSVSDTGKRTDGTVRALFILGATRETVPKIKKEEGIISDSERELFNTLPKTDSVTHYNRRMEFELVRAFSEVSEKIYISGALSSPDGTKLELSDIFESLMHMFPNIKCTDEKWFKKLMYVSVPEEMLHRLLLKLSGDEKLSDVDSAVLDWFNENERYTDSFGLVEEALKYKTLTGRISDRISAELYKEVTRYSVSRLEKYFKCPFSYFMDYGLGVEEEKEYGMQASDAGTLVHFATSRFCEEVEKGADGFDEKKERWNSLTDEAARIIIDGIFDEWKSKCDNDSYMENVFGRIYDTMLRTAKMITVSMQKSKYGILSCELDFTGFKLETERGLAELRGIIDRIDYFDEGDKKYVRIIDYKTGRKEFKPENIINGSDLQLIIYAMAAESKIEENASITGMYYNSLKKYIASGKTMTEAESELVKNSKLAGCLFAPVDINGTPDIKTGIDMDADLETVNKSSYLPLEITKKGTYNGRSSKVETDVFYAGITDYVKKLVTGAVSEIENGDVRVYPLEKSGVCTYCPYSSVCMYDSENGAETNKGEGVKDILKELRGEEDE